VTATLTPNTLTHIRLAGDSPTLLSVKRMMRSRGVTTARVVDLMGALGSRGSNAAATKFIYTRGAGG